SKLEPSAITLLERPVEQRMQTLKMLKAQKDLETRVVTKKARHDEEKAKAATAEEKRQEQIKELCKQYNTFLNEGKYKEAEIAAAKAHELEPENPSLEAMLKVARVQYNQIKYDEIKDRKEKTFVDRMNETDDPGPNVTSENPLAVDAKRLAVARERNMKG